MSARTRTNPSGAEPVPGWQARSERTAGFGDRYGLVYVDFHTQRRTPESVAQSMQPPRGRLIDRRVASRSALTISSMLRFTFKRH